jgi:probable rRNA maturation factor
MDSDECDIRVEISCEIDKTFDLEKFKLLAESVCRRFSVAAASVSIAIIDDDAIAVINKQFLDHTGPTDVISFDLSDEDDGAEADKNFEIVINADQAARQSADRAHDTESELALYITHGLLHNFGFDDHDEADSKKMHQMEDEILQDEGFGAIYGSK